MRLRLESNYNLALLGAALARRPFATNVDDGGYNLFAANLLNFDSDLYSEHYDGLIISLDLEYLDKTTHFYDFLGKNDGEIENLVYETVHEIVNVISGFMKRRPETVVCLMTFPLAVDTPFNRLEVNSAGWTTNKIISEVNRCLVEKSLSISNLFLLDLDNLIRRFGYENIFDNRMKYLAKSPYSQFGLESIAKDIEFFFTTATSASKKLLVLDLDNTLWGGIAGEDGIGGIEISNDGVGRAYYDFQKSILSLKRRGVLLAICSKNNEADVKGIFESHPDMVLSWDDFVVRKINWTDKATNIKEIVTELNIGFESVVFIDDNPAERQWVNNSLPGVMVPDFPEEPSLLPDLISKLHVFDTFSITQDDLDKTEKYQSESARRQVERESITYDEFLGSLDIKCRVFELNSEYLKRAAQLVNKTNQFNLSTKRYTESQLLSYAESDQSDVLLLGVSDKFGDYGIVGLAILVRADAGTTVDTFLLSCRVLGKKVEEAFLVSMAEFSMTRWASEFLVVPFVPSFKNDQVHKFLSDVCDESSQTLDGSTHFHFFPGRLPFPDHIEVKL